MRLSHRSGGLSQLPIAAEWIRMCRKMVQDALLHLGIRPAMGYVYRMADSMDGHLPDLSSFKFVRLMHAMILVFMALCLIAGGGCASLSSQPVEKVWRCQAEADAAVQGGDWNAALTLHQALVLQAPENCLAIYHLGYISGKLGERSTEAAQYEKAVKCGYDRDDRLFYNLGMAYGDLGRIREAIEAFESAVRLNDTRTDNHFGLGIMFQAAGQYDEAATAFTRTLSLDSSHLDARLALCRTLLDQGRLKTARLHLEALSRMNPDSEDVRRLWRLYQRRRIKLYE